jgi:hypothetical protein
MLWIGESIGPVERACMSSVVRQGHRVSLYCYQRPDGVPAGVELCDAGAILPRHVLIRQAGGNVALFADRFRLELQRRGLGIWVDCNVYLLAPLRPTGPIFVGEDGAGGLETCVLRLAQESPLLAGLLDLFREETVPQWLPLPARLQAHWRRLTAGRTGVARMPAASVGRTALTRLADAHALIGTALPASAFCPVPAQRADWIIDPSLSLDRMVAPDTIALHLWGDRIGSYKNKPAPLGSFLARLQAEAFA